MNYGEFRYSIEILRSKTKEALDITSSTHKAEMKIGLEALVELLIKDLEKTGYCLDDKQEESVGEDLDFLVEEIGKI